MDRTYLQWNLPNWLTVILMVSVGMALVGFVTSALRHYNGTAQVDDKAPVN